jgi:hypothetical protein
MWFFVPGVVVTLLAFNLFKRLAADRIEALTARLRGSSLFVSRGELVDGNRHLDVALALTDSAFIFEGPDGQSSFDRKWIREVEYQNELLRLRCFSKTLEFALTPNVVRQWKSILPPHRIKGEKA